jgi:hypothetical protein
MVGEASIDRPEAERSQKKKFAAHWKHIFIKMVQLAVIMSRRESRW